ncbi:hypothetical protein QQY66_34315 [Streptomyces sp. DG2A-72]|uniref:hypothetical protein n=1 Tax=Streptomyces sp. DG2A-72 TaxID=3051386 RepID=UPI00265BE332|nr:hypothetical protein [Streptomyces sp. DG2A-72]MDO0936536.1 hypothetical protein [Streptomyces sp. DG2A-72]
MTGQWGLAVTRAQQLASAALTVTDNNWEYTGTRNVLAIALAALGRQRAGGVEAVTLGSLLWHLSRLNGGVRELATPLVGADLALSTDTDPATVDDDSDPLIATWLWLTRTWPADPHSPLSKQRWDGMTRGLARGSAEPAVVVCRGLAVDAVCHALEEELHRPLPTGTHVQGVGGEFDGVTGSVIAPAWYFDDERRDLSGGPLPHGYEIQLAPPTADNTVNVIWRSAALQVVLDEEAWEETHRSAYGLDAWTRAERQAWVLTQRHIGYHADDLDLYASGTASTPEAISEREDTWLPANRILALAVWRAARHEGLLVDDVDLARPLWWLGGALHERLFADPLPAWDPAPVTGSWQELREREDELLEAARGIATWHQLRDLHDNRPLRDTQDATSLEPPLVLLGDRCRDLTSGPFRDGQPPRWQPAVAYATKAVAEAIHQLHTGEWAPQAQARQAAAELLPTLQALPDTPELPGHVQGPAWIQRALRIGHLRATLRTVQEHHKGEAELDVHPAQPLGLAIGLVWNALDDSNPALSGLEAVWAQRQHDVARWERTHLPLALRAYIRALEELASTLGTLCLDLNTGHSGH